MLFPFTFLRACVPVASYFSCRWVHHKSVNDVAFGRTLNTEVHNKAFYAAAFIMEKSPLSPTSIKWADRAVSGRFVVAAAAPIQLTVVQCKAAIKNGNLGWLGEFLRIYQDPAKWCVNLDFDLCIAWARTCYFLTPITDLVYLKYLCQRIKTSGLIMMDFEALVALGPKGPMSCSQRRFIRGKSKATKGARAPRRFQS